MYNITKYTLPFPKGGKGAEWLPEPKKDKKPVGQTPNPVCPCLMSKHSSGL